MPEVKEVKTEEQEVQAEIADLYKLLTGDERRKVAVIIRQSQDTVRRYATDEDGVKKLATGLLMRDAMKDVIAERGNSKAA